MVGLTPVFPVLPFVWRGLVLRVTYRDPVRAGALVRHSG